MSVSTTSRRLIARRKASHSTRGGPRIVNEKDRARELAQQAARSGKLVRPDACQCCGRSKDLQRHHYDYARPLDVQWVCNQCHVLLDHIRIFPASLPVCLDDFPEYLRRFWRENGGTKQERAWRAVDAALRMGVLVHPEVCQVCGQSKDSPWKMRYPGFELYGDHVHVFLRVVERFDPEREILPYHVDYAKPLNVHWVCARCYNLLEHSRGGGTFSEAVRSIRAQRKRIRTPSTPGN